MKGTAVEHPTAARSRPNRLAEGDAAISPWMLGLAAVAYLPLVFAGYSADIDAFEVLAAGERLIAGGGYVPSRPPGFPVFEAGAGVLDRIGGSIATNLGSVVLTLGALWGFQRIGSRLRVPHVGLLTVMLALHPLLWAAAAETMDYTWALGFGLAGGAMLLDRRWVPAGLLFALAIGSRFTSALFIVPLLAFAFVMMRSDRRRVGLAAALAFGLGALLYLPAVAYYGGSADLLVPVGADEAAQWRLVDRLGRFGYKNVYVWGLPGALVLGGLTIRGVVRHRERLMDRRPVLLLVLAVFLLYQLLFLRFPFQVQYLLPMVPFVLLAAGMLMERRALLALMAAVLLFNAFSLNVARPDDPNRARKAEVGLWLEPGHLMIEVAQRLQVRPCHDRDCWRALSANGRFPELRGVGLDLLGTNRIARIDATGAREAVEGSR